MTQSQKILRHLRTGKHITPLEAIGLYGVFRLAARINELRAAGHNITTQLVRDTMNRPYARYRLVP